MINVYVVSQSQDTSNQWNQSEITKIIGIFDSKEKADNWLRNTAGYVGWGEENRLKGLWFDVHKVTLNQINELANEE